MANGIDNYVITSNSGSTMQYVCTIWAVQTLDDGCIKFIVAMVLGLKFLRELGLNVTQFFLPPSSGVVRWEKMAVVVSCVLFIGGACNWGSWLEDEQGKFWRCDKAAIGTGY